MSYELYVFCPECKDFHDTGIRVPVEDSFDVLTVTSVYKDKELPSVVEAMMNDELVCPKTGNSFRQENPDHMILVRPGIRHSESYPDSATPSS